MLTVASHSSPAPYRAVTLGPSSHSPPPIDAPPMSRPGPISASQLRAVKRGGSGSSPLLHGGISALPT
jgi:hypothetical protein